MTSSHHAVATLDTLLRADPELQASLREATDLDQFAQIAAACARRHGMNLDANDLRAQIEASVEQASAATAEPHVELTDQQMEKVVGASSSSEMDQIEMIRKRALESKKAESTEWLERTQTGPRPEIVIYKIN